MAFVHRATEVLSRHPKLCGLAAGGSWINQNMDAFSDIDLVVVSPPEFEKEIASERRTIAESLGDLLVGFTGEHVGEPRLFICLYDHPLLHVDLKFITLSDVEHRVENPIVLWEKDKALSSVLARTPYRFPLPDAQWIEDRFWVWVHYAALKLGRGELMECTDFLAFLRMQVLGPLALMRNGKLPRGVRRVETETITADFERLKKTVSSYDKAACGKAMLEAVELYRDLRAAQALPALKINDRAEYQAIAFLKDVINVIKKSGNE